MKDKIFIKNQTAQGFEYFLKTERQPAASTDP